MPKVGILGCEATTRDMDCVMIGCFGNMRGRNGMFERYSEDDPPELVGIISCGGCPTAIGADRVWQKVKALKEYGIEALHLTSRETESGIPIAPNMTRIMRLPDMKIRGRKTTTVVSVASVTASAI